ncbi:MAG: hypothetical protein ACI9MR_000014 [Myxococcota bacterium]|jgi:hypothetical protein
MALTHWAVVELVESTVAALTPAEMASASDVYTSLHGATIDELAMVHADRRFMVMDTAPPRRTPGMSGECVRVTLPLTVAITYHVSQESRRRRMADVWQIDACFRDIQRNADVYSVAVVPQQNRLIAGDNSLRVQASWSLEIEYRTTEAS